MTIFLLFSLILIFNLNFHIIKSHSSELKCGACLAIVDEFVHEISLVDPNELIQVGSFRIDPQGNQKLNKIPLKESELKMIEILDKVCNYMSTYGTTDSDSGDRIYMRMTSPEGKPSNKIIMPLTNPQRFVNVCLDLVDDYQEDMIGVFKRGDEMYEKLCIDTCDACNGRNVTEFENHKLNVKYSDRGVKAIPKSAYEEL